MLISRAPPKLLAMKVKPVPTCWDWPMLPAANRWTEGNSFNSYASKTTRASSHSPKFKTTVILQTSKRISSGLTSQPQKTPSSVDLCSTILSRPDTHNYSMIVRNEIEFVKRLKLSHKALQLDELTETSSVHLVIATGRAHRNILWEFNASLVSLRSCSHPLSHWQYFKHVRRDQLK